MVARPHVRTRIVTAALPAYVPAGTVYDDMVEATLPVLAHVVPPLVEYPSS